MAAKTSTNKRGFADRSRIVRVLMSPYVHILLTVIVSCYVAISRSQSLQLDTINNKNGAVIKPLLIPRPPGSQNHKQVQQHIRSFYRSINWHEQVHVFTADTPKGPIQMANLIFTLNPKARQRIVLSAHYDSKLTANDGRRGEEGAFVGATDSAAPCAMIMELCRAMTAVIKNDDVTLQAVFFDGEEALVNWTASDSLYGSRQLAQLWAANNENPNDFSLQNMRLFVLLDLLGAARPRIPSYSDVTAREFKQLVAIEERLTADGVIHKDPSTTGITYFHYIDRVGEGLLVLDDHVPFHQRGYKHILHLIPSPFPPVWHKMADNGDALDGPTIDDLMMILLEFIKMQF